MILKPLEYENMNKIILERNKVMETLRTSFMINIDMQKEYFLNTICNRGSNTFYWAVYDECGIGQRNKTTKKIEYENKEFIAYGGIEHYERHNNIGELSLLVFEEYRNNGYGKKIVDLFLDNAFNYLAIENVYLECYTCNKPGIIFWQKIIDKYNAYKTILPNRKYYKGEYHNSLYGNISKENFNESKS